MKPQPIICFGLLLTALLVLSGIAAAQEDAASGTLPADTIQPYNGPIGPDSPLYGLKLALEDMDESFTANQTRKIDLQMDHAEIRIAEAKKELDDGRDDLAQEALGRYWQKMNLTNTSITNWTGNATGLLHAQEMITKHQFVLQQLLQTHPGNPGLMRAYNNSQELEEKFADKTASWFNRTPGNGNKTFRPESRGGSGKDHPGWPAMNETVTTTPGQTTGSDHQNQKEGQQHDQQQGQDGQHGNQQGGGQQNGNANNADRGKGNSHAR